VGAARPLPQRPLRRTRHASPLLRSLRWPPRHLKAGAIRKMGS
jgi:hypothetical protein